MADDFWKALAYGFFGLFVIHGSLEPRARRNAADQAREAFGHTGTVVATMEPRGMFGLYANDIWAVDIYGQGNRATELPFRLYPRGGWKGSIRHLRFHLTDFELNGLPVARLEGDIPFAKYDISRALLRGRLHLRGAEAGTARVFLSAANLRGFVERKFGALMSEVDVSFLTDRLRIRGQYALLGSPQSFEATAGMTVREGRYVDLSDADFRLDGKPLPRATLTSLLRQINPVLDTERDLRLRDLFTLKTIRIGGKYIQIEGVLRLPVEAASDLRGEKTP